MTQGFQNAKDIENPIQTASFLMKNPVFKGFFEIFFLFFNFFQKPKKYLETILKYTFHKIFIKISQKLRPADRWTQRYRKFAPPAQYDSNTTNTPPNASYTTGLTQWMGNFNFPTTVNTTGFALDKTLSGELYIQQAAIQQGSREIEQNFSLRFYIAVQA